MGQRILAEHAVQGRGCSAVRITGTAAFRLVPHAITDGIPGAVGVLLNAVGENSVPSWRDRVCRRRARIRARCTVVFEDQNSDDVDLVPSMRSSTCCCRRRICHRDIDVWQMPRDTVGAAADIRVSRVVDAAFADRDLGDPQVEPIPFFAVRTGGNRRLASKSFRAWLWAVAMGGPAGEDPRGQVVDQC